MAAVTICSDFGAQENKVTVSIIFPSICHEVMGLDAMIFVSQMLSFKSAFSLLPLLPSRSSLVPVHFLSCIICIPEVVDISPSHFYSICDSSSLAFHMSYSAYKLDKCRDNIQLWCTPFPILNQSIFPCLVLTVASWPAYRFCRRQVRWSGIPIMWRIFHNLLRSTQSKALAQSMKQMFFWNSLAFSMIQQKLAIWPLVLCLF